MPTFQSPDLDIDYRDDGPRDGSPVLLLHGWPDDRSTWDAVAATLNTHGLRTIVPSLRGFGDTRFRSADTPRTGNSAMLALDAIALVDGLGIERFQVAGHDWGSNIAEALAVGWPERVKRMALLSTPPRLGGMPTPAFRQAQRYWYHWYMATKRGAEAVRKDPKGFARIMWEDWAPPGWFDEDTFARVSKSWENPDFVDVTLHSYQSRWEEAPPDPRSAWLYEKVNATKTLSLPTLFFQGNVDGVTAPAMSEKVGAKFTGPFERIVLGGVGHFPTREAPAEVAARLAAFFGER